MVISTFKAGNLASESAPRPYGGQIKGVVGAVSIRLEEILVGETAVHCMRIPLVMKSLRHCHFDILGEL